MKKYLLITALCAVNFAYADGFENLKNLQNQFHVLIYNAGDLGAATPAPEVPYIAGLLTNPVESIGAGEERHIYEFLYDQPSGRNRKAIPDIDQAKVDAFNTINFTNFQRYRSYQDSGHSVLGVAAQEQLPPIEKVTIGKGEIESESSVPSLEEVQEHKKTLKNQVDIKLLTELEEELAKGPISRVGAELDRFNDLKQLFTLLVAKDPGNSDILAQKALDKKRTDLRTKLKSTGTGVTTTSVSATAPKSLLERVREHKKTLRNQVDIELLTELESELSGGASEASPASDRYNDLVEFFNLLTTEGPGLKDVRAQRELDNNIKTLRERLKPSGASVIAAASNDATPENVQLAIDSKRYDNNLLNELLQRLKRPHLNNTPYQQYRFDRLNSWFKNKDKPAIAAPQLKLINSIPAFVGEIDVMDVRHAISNLLPANKQQLENLDTELNKQYASAVGDIANQKKSEIDTNKEKIKQIDKDQELLEELVAGLNGAAVDLLRMQKLKELYMTLIAGKDFVSLLASQRRDLSALVPAEGAKPSGSGRLINMANGGVISGISDNSAIADKKKEIKDLKKQENQAYEAEDDEAQERAKKKLAKAYEELAILGDVEGVLDIERIDSDDLSDNEKRDIYVRIYNALEAGPRTSSEDAVFLRVAGKQGVRKVSAAPVRPFPLDGNAGGGGVQLKPTTPPRSSLEAVASVTESLGGVVASEQIVAEINRLGESSSNKKEILALVQGYLDGLQQNEQQKAIIREIIPTIPEKITKPTIRTDVTNLMKEMTK